VNQKARTRFFEKKRGKKLLLVSRPRSFIRHARGSGHPRLECNGASNAHAPRTKVFCGAFFQKSDRFALPSF